MYKANASTKMKVYRSGLNVSLLETQHIKLQWPWQNLIQYNVFRILVLIDILMAYFIMNVSISCIYQQTNFKCKF